MKQEELDKLRTQMIKEDKGRDMHTRPIYVVYDWERVPSDSDYTSDYEYVDCEGLIADNETELFEYIEEHHCEHIDITLKKPTDEEQRHIYDMIEWLKENNPKIDFEGIRQVYYIKHRRFVQQFMTREAAQNHIDANSYHYKEPHIYIECLWRNHEMINLRNAILNGELQIKK